MVLVYFQEGMVSGAYVIVLVAIPFPNIFASLDLILRRPVNVYFQSSSLSAHSSEMTLHHFFFDCIFMVKYSHGRKGTRANGTSLAPSNSTSSGCLSQYYYNGGFFTSSLILVLLLCAVV